MIFLAGMLLAYISLRWWYALLDIRLPAIVLISLGFLRIYRSKYLKTRRLALNFLFGLSLAALIAAMAQINFLQKVELAQQVNKETVLMGEVNSLFIGNTAYPTVLFKITAINQQKLPWHEQIIAQLHWQSDQPLKQGQRWKITARLREPYGRANEAGFSAEPFFLAHGIHSKGSVLSATLFDNKLALRQQLFDAVAPPVSALPSGRFLLALAFGEQDLLTQEDWQHLRDSGLAHLLAISGLHIGFAYLLGFAFGRILAPLASRRDRLVWLPFITGLLIAFIYTWLAGFLIPSQRTLLALAVYTLLRLSGLAIGPFALLLLVACIVLSFDPFAIFSASFWLSFGAVLLLCCMGALVKTQHPPGKQAKAAQWGRMLVVIQAFLTVGMLPLMKVWFAGTSASGFLFNLFAVPLVSLVCVPLILIALLGSMVGTDLVWILADIAITPLMWLLPLSRAQWFSLAHFDLLWLFLLPLFALAIFYLRWRRLSFSFVLLAILLFWRAPTKESSAWQIDVLDVGHGLAVLLTQDDESVLYDTGASWENGSIAQQVITPILQKRGAKLVGMLLSHNDKDHAGGAPWILQQHILAREPHGWVRTVNADVGFLPCLAGEKWQWRKLTFEVLHPQKAVADPQNRDSCVVNVSDGRHALLLTGDLPKMQELSLVKSGAPLKADILLAAHHGSKSSSSAAFLDAVDASLVLISNGRYMPWPLPHPETLQRYKARKMRWYETARQGQLRVEISRDNLQVKTFRFDLAPYWYFKLFGQAASSE